MYNGQKSLLIFGAGPLQCSIINVARDNNYYTVVIDPDDSAIGKSIADKYIRVDGQDYSKTLSIAKQYSIDGIVTAATDKPLLMMAKIAKELNLPFPSCAAIKNTIDKSLFKKALMECSLPCAKGKLIFSISDLSNFSYPVVLKPIDSSGSRGVVVCRTLGEAKDAYNDVLELTEAPILVEEFLIGDEISVECLVFGGQVYIIQMTDKKITQPPFNVELSQVQPSKYLSKHREKIALYLQRIVDYLKLDNCALHPEFKVNGEKVFFVEMGPRLGGDYITSHLTPLSTGVNIELELIKVATSQKNIVVTPNVRRAALVKYLELEPSKRVKKINRHKINKITGSLVLWVDKLVEGMEIPVITDSLSRYAQFIMVNDSLESLIVLSQELEQNLSDCIEVE